jgi:hypothetical protein
VYAYCKRCRAVYDILALHQDRPYTHRCPECDLPLLDPSPRRLRQIIEVRREERRKPS